VREQVLAKVHIVERECVVKTVLGGTQLQEGNILYIAVLVLLPLCNLDWIAEGMIEELQW
jgi:hypothetical protein